MNLNIDEEDINLVHGNPSRPKQVQKLGISEDNSKEYSGILRNLNVRHGKLPPDVTKMPEVILQDVEAGDDFK